MRLWSVRRKKQERFPSKTLIINSAFPTSRNGTFCTSNLYREVFCGPDWSFLVMSVAQLWVRVQQTASGTAKFEYAVLLAAIESFLPSYLVKQPGPGTQPTLNFEKAPADAFYTTQIPGIVATYLCSAFNTRGLLCITALKAPLLSPHRNILPLVQNCFHCYSRGMFSMHCKAVTACSGKMADRQCNLIVQVLKALSEAAVVYGEITLRN